MFYNRVHIHACGLTILAQRRQHVMISDEVQHQADWADQQSRVEKEIK